MLKFKCFSISDLALRNSCMSARYILIVIVSSLMVSMLHPGYKVVKRKNDEAVRKLLMPCA